jgi:hypothetical protein
MQAGPLKQASGVDLIGRLSNPRVRALVHQLHKAVARYGSE